MIVWGIRRKYKGAEKWLVFAYFSRASAWGYARDRRKEERDSAVKWSVHKIRLDVLPSCGCGIVDDVGVTCKRHSKEGRKS